MPPTLILAALPNELRAAQRKLARGPRANDSSASSSNACGLGRCASSMTFESRERKLADHGLPPVAMKEKRSQIPQIALASYVFATTGIGPQRVAQTLPALLDAHRPDRVIHLGFAGGLDPALRPGDTFPIREVRTLAGEPSLQLPTPKIGRGLPPHLAPRTLVSVARAAYTPQAKRQLREQSDADAVDMETYAVATICRRHGVPLFAFRAITDAAGEALPPGILALTAADGRPRLLATLGYLARHPHRLPALIRLGRRAARCAAALAAAAALTLNTHDAREDRP